MKEPNSHPLSSVELLNAFRENLSLTPDIDLDVLTIVSDDLFRIGIDKKLAAKSVSDKLLKLAEARSEEDNDSK